MADPNVIIVRSSGISGNRAAQIVDEIAALSDVYQAIDNFRGGITRAEAVIQCAEGWRAADGELVWLDGVAYYGVTGATDIADLPGLIPNGEITFKHFGGVGDGSADDTAAIVATNAYLLSITNTGGTQFSENGNIPVYIPSGTWKSTAGTTFVVKGFGVKLYGDGDMSRLRNVAVMVDGTAFQTDLSDFMVSNVTGNAIVSIVDNGSGFARVTTTNPHGFSVGNDWVRLNRTGVEDYDNQSFAHTVTAVVSTTIMDLDVAYSVTLGAVGVVGGDAIVVHKNADYTTINRTHQKSCAGASIIVDAASSTRMMQNRGEKSYKGLVCLPGSNNTHDLDSNFENNADSGIDVSGNGEYKFIGTRAAGSGYNSTAAGGWEDIRVRSGLNGGAVVENYWSGISASGARMGGRRYDVVSVANNGAGKVRVTTATPHEMVPGYSDVQLNGVTGYSATNTYVLDVISPTIIDLNIAYTTPVGVVGQVWANGWNLAIYSLTKPLLICNDQLFQGGNINYTKIDGAYKIQFNGTRLKQQIWLADATYDNRIFIVSDNRGRNDLNNFADVNPSGPGSVSGWTRFGFMVDSPAGFAVNGTERGGIQYPDTNAGLGANNLPTVHEASVGKDGVIIKGTLTSNGVKTLSISGEIQAPMRTFTTAQLLDKTHAVNTTNKAAEVFIRDSTTKKVMVANGSINTSTWTSADGATTITPV